MNTADRRRAERFGQQVTERLLALEPLSRMRVEGETDPKGHIRASLRVEITSILTDEGAKEDTTS